MIDKHIHLHSVLKAIQSVNRLILGSKECHSLLQKICDILVDVRDYDAAWFRLLEDSSTFAAIKDSHLRENICSSSTHMMKDYQPLCLKTALTQTQKFSMVNKATECKDCLLKSACTGKETAIIRVKHAGRFFGILVIWFAPDVGVNEEEKELLKYIADNIAFALHNLEREKSLKQAREALWESEEKYQLLVKNANDAIFIGQDNAVTFLNPKVEQLTGHSLGELAKIPFTHLIHPEDRSMVLENLRKKLKEEKLPSTHSFRIINKAGKELWVQHNTIPICWEGRPATLNFLRDITLRKELELQFRQAQRMEAIGTLAGGIAHDFNNLLSVIMGYTELTKDDLLEDSHAKANLKEVLKAANRAKDLVKQILTFSRQSEQKHMPTLIHLLVKEVLKLLRSTLPTTIEIRQNIADSGTILADPTQIHQVIINLCTNAYHAMMEKGGILEITLSQVNLDADDVAQYADLSPGQYVRLTVSDTGHGMSNAVMERIFDPYFTTKENDKGAGLGLAVVHGIIKSHNGAITVFSEPEKGTTFQVYLPRITTNPVAETTPTTPIPKGNAHILFVDDEEPLAQLGKQMLEHLGYTVTTQTNSVEALKAFRVQPDKFDLVVTDMTMPNMTGVQLAKELMKTRPDIPIILCTGFSECITKEQAQAIGVHAFVMKPVLKNEIAKIVRSGLDRKPLHLAHS